VAAGGCRTQRQTRRHPHRLLRAGQWEEQLWWLVSGPADDHAGVMAFMDMLGMFAEFETNLRKERQAEGIAKAKAAGVYKGRPRSIDANKVRDLKEKGLGASEIAKALKIGRASVYRALEA
jgi:DNA invertase Pin-like site-specific DNA recombinase